MLLISPFLDYDFMQRALLAVILLSISASPVGALLLLRRMSLVGDTMSHAILPGVAIAYMIWGISIGFMSIAGMMSALLVALVAGYVARRTKLYEDVSFASFYLISIAFGVTLISVYGNNVDLIGLLFGSLLGISDTGLFLITFATAFTLTIFTLFYRGIVIESFDADFLRLMRAPAGMLHSLFLCCLVVNLIAAFQVLGSLLAVGLLILPAVIARMWFKSLPRLIGGAAAIGIASSYLGLLASFYLNVPAGPAIILLLAGFYLFSVVYSLAWANSGNKKAAFIRS